MQIDQISIARAANAAHYEYLDTVRKRTEETRLEHGHIPFRDGASQPKQVRFRLSGKDGFTSSRKRACDGGRGISSGEGIWHKKRSPSTELLIKNGRRPTFPQESRKSSAEKACFLCREQRKLSGEQVRLLSRSEVV